MQKSASSVVIPMSAGRSVRFTAANGKIQVIAQGYVTPRELAEAKLEAIQKLADAAGGALRDGGETYTPRRDPGQPARNYQTRLLQRPGGGR